MISAPPPSAGLRQRYLPNLSNAPLKESSAIPKSLMGAAVGLLALQGSVVKTDASPSLPSFATGWRNQQLGDPDYCAEVPAPPRSNIEHCALTFYQPSNPLPADRSTLAVLSSVTCSGTGDLEKTQMNCLRAQVLSQLADPLRSEFLPGPAVQCMPNVEYSGTSALSCESRLQVMNADHRFCDVFTNSTAPNAQKYCASADAIAAQAYYDETGCCDHLCCGCCGRHDARNPEAPLPAPPPLNNASSSYCSPSVFGTMMLTLASTAINSIRTRLF